METKNIVALVAAASLGAVGATVVAQPSEPLLRPAIVSVYAHPQKDGGFDFTARAEGAALPEKGKATIWNLTWRLSEKEQVAAAQVLLKASVEEKEKQK